MEKGHFLAKYKGKHKYAIKTMILAIIVLILIGLDCRLRIQKYSLEIDAAAESIRIALVTDLHSCKYGEQQQTLINALVKQNPDVVLLGGDIFDDVLPNTNTKYFLEGIAGAFPCYYVTGNHEYWSGKEGFAAKMSILEEYGIPVLSGESKTITIHGTRLNICGVDDPDAYLLDMDDEVYTGFAQQLENVKKATQNGDYTILLSHRPERFAEYADYGFDLVLCGHAHGGQWRFPVLCNGLYAPNQGLFPQYAGGLYQQAATTMIVSRGLARESTLVPRLFNRPELVIVELL